MNNLDSQLIFEAYNEEVIDEGLTDVAKKAAQYGAIGAAAAQSALGSPPAKAASAAEPPAMTQTAKAQGSDSFEQLIQKMNQDADQSAAKSLEKIKELSAGLNKMQADFEALSKDMGDPVAQLKALELQHKMEIAKQDYQAKQHEIESNKVYKMGQDKKISVEQMDKMLNDLDKKYGFDIDIEKARQLFQ